MRTTGSDEVDFLARDPEGRHELIQVCSDASDPAAAEPELRAVVDAEPRYPDTTRRLLTPTRDGLPAALPSGVTAQPAYEWLLSTTVTA